jgi:hypothetical protein
MQVEGTGSVPAGRCHDTLLVGFNGIAQRPRRCARAGEAQTRRPVRRFDQGHDPVFL